MMAEHENEINTKEAIAERLRDVPADIREFVADGELDSILDSLRNQYGLDDDRIGTVRAETLLVLAGFEPMSAFERTLRDELSGDRPTIGRVVSDIEMLVFRGFRAELSVFDHELTQDETATKEAGGTIVEERVDQLPDELRAALTSPKVQAAVQRIGRDRGLMIDQIGELADQIRLILLGQAKGSDFVDDVRKRLNISDELARSITTDINNDVRDAMRRTIEENRRRVESSRNSPTVGASVSAVERAGGFTIELRPDANPAPAAPIGAEQAPIPADLPIETKDEILGHIESPAPAAAAPVPTSPVAAPKPVVPPAAGQPIAPAPKQSLAEELLHAPSAAPGQKGSSSDPYREPIE